MLVINLIFLAYIIEFIETSAQFLHNQMGFIYRSSIKGKMFLGLYMTETKKVKVTPGCVDYVCGSLTKHHF